MEAPGGSIQDFEAVFLTQQCSIGVYPFMFGKMEDFQPVVDKLIEVCMSFSET